MVARVTSLAAMALLLVACGGSSRSEQPDPSPPAAATATPAATAASPTVQQLGSDELLTLGEDIYQRTAGGVGCQYCHGTDARGKVGPTVRGKSAEAIQQALGTVEQMSMISLTDQEIEAVATYLEYLESQP